MEDRIFSWKKVVPQQPAQGQKLFNTFFFSHSEKSGERQTFREREREGRKKYRLDRMKRDGKENENGKQGSKEGEKTKNQDSAESPGNSY